MKIGMVSALSLSVVSCSSDDDGDAVTAYCVTQDDDLSTGAPAPFPTEGPDGFKVVDDDNCDDPDSSSSTTRSSHSSYFWYYGGVRTQSGRVRAGSMSMPSGTNITSAEGKTIRSGFGGSSSHGSSGG
ncbi:hypothetical protein ACGFNU_10635 [Spirillospora sp. NPDC048911]|uniref:hypothetical protein n=1 Tax=Spirillospora sp. NPDC048911 TaxID=3364527 RepID=UPI00371D7F06